MSRLRILALFATLIALASAFAACGSGGSSDDPQTIVDEATLQGIESGRLYLRTEVDVRGARNGHIAFLLTGPFQSKSEAELPELDLSARAKGSLDGEKIDFDGSFTLLGSKAYVGYEGTEYEVDPTTFNFVKSLIKQTGAGENKSSEATACQDAVSKLKVADFIDNLSSEGGGESDTTRVSGDLNGPGAIDALVELTEDPACSEQLSAAGPLPSTAELEKAKGTIEDSIKEAHVELYVGDDHIVRRIVVQAPSIELPKEASGESGAESLGLEFDLTLNGVNEEQTVSAPQQSKPLSDLFLKLGINPIELLELFQGQGGAGGLNGLLEGLGSSGSTQ